MREVTYEAAASELGMTRRELMPWLRELGWVNRHNEPMHDRVHVGHMVRRRHQYKDSTGTWQPAKRYTGRLTGLGVYELKKLQGGSYGRSSAKTTRVGIGRAEQSEFRGDHAQQGAGAGQEKRVGDK